MQVSRWKVMKLMQEEGLRCQQRRAYKVTTKAIPGAEVAPNLLKQNFNPPESDLVWASDIAYLRTGEGWLYLAAIMDLHSLRIVGWCIDKRMTSSLVCRALMQAYNLRNPPRGLVVHKLRVAVHRKSFPGFTELLWSEKQHGRRGSVLG